MASLKYRRMIARGLNRRQAGLLGGRYFRGIGNRATLTTALAGANNDVTLIARTPGVGGNSITFTIAVPAGAGVSESVGVVGSAITYNTSTAGAGVSNATANQMVKALLASPAASALVWSQVAVPGNDGTGVVVAMASTPLTGAA